ncbi:helix-turn-helix domain-containing protein [Streptomyces microflavus]|uniref:helix-turn-helix domain-containing protein n=1 Tax=Streptomyces microflavus TaxID=1919 RepID=UPI0036921051
MPGRPMKAIPPDVPPARRKLTELLRELRAGSDRTLAQIAQEARVHASSLSRALSADSLPTWHTVSAFADAISATEVTRARLRSLYAQAAGEPVPSHTRGAVEAAYQELVQIGALRDLYQEAGAPSLNDLAARTKMSRSAVHRVLTGQSAAGAGTLAVALLPYLPPATAEDWTERIYWTLQEPFSPAGAAPLFSLPPGVGEDVAQELDAFLHSLRTVRNLIAHGRVKADWAIAAQVMAMAATVERSSHGGPPGTQTRPSAAVATGEDGTES